MATQRSARAASTRSEAGAPPAPRLPHERDESAHSTGAEPRPVIEQASDDLARGLVDTDRGAVADAVYRRQKTAAPKSAGPRRGGKR